MWDARRLLFLLGPAALAGSACIVSVDGLSGGAFPDTDASPVEGSSTADGSSRDADASDAADAVVPKDGAVSSDAASMYRAIVVADAPLAYFRLDEASGTTAMDSSGFGNHSPYSAGFTFGAAGAIVHDPDTAVTLDGAGGCVAMNSNFGNFSGTNPFTLEVWAKPSMLDAIYRMAFSREAYVGTGHQAMFLFARGGDALGFQRIVDDTLVQILVSPPTLNVFSHIVATYDGAELALYVNGVEVGRTPDARSMPPISAPLYVGCGGVNAHGFTGVLDEAAIYNKALPATVVGMHYQAGASP